jgi:glycosyltransferase involved in cell wall biosynthesis
MKISIAMATYNGSKYIQEQLGSFVNQTRQPDELVVCDDNSTDETVSILSKFAKEAPFEVRVFVNQENLGYSQNFSRALSLCTGDLLFLSDQDDVWFNEKIETIQHLAEEDEFTQIFMNDAELVHHDLSPTGLTKLGQIHSAGLPNSFFVMGCCMAIRKSFLEHLLPIPVQFNHDSWLSKLGNGLQRRKIISQPLQLYRRHSSNESKILVNKTRGINKLELTIDRLKKLLQKIKEYNDLKQAIVSTNLILEVINKWIQETDDQCLKSNLFEFKRSQQEIKEALEERLKIRSIALTSRIFYGWHFYHRHGYDKFNGIQSFFRDIIS